MSTVEHSSVSIKNVIEAGTRLEASFYNASNLRLRTAIESSKWDKRPISGPNGFADVHYPGRFKRVFLEYSDLPIYRPSQITDLKPYPDLFLSDKTPANIDGLRVSKNQILMTRSGSVGVVSLVSRTYNNQIFSDDLLRISCHDPVDTGYLYALLKSEAGQNLVTTNNYGAVIKHIEPAHLEKVLLPNLSKDLKSRINQLIQTSFDKRDTANEKLAKAEHTLILYLNLPPIRDIGTKDIDSHSVRANELSDRFEATYHSTKVNKILEYLNKADCDVKEVSSPDLTKKIILPGRFKRVYVNKDNGITFFGGKQIFELNPSNKKYLSTLLHDSRIKDQLTLHEDMVLITCSGTIGRVQITPKHWDGWTLNQHVLRLVARDRSSASLMYIWLQSPYGQLLIKRFSYGAVVDEIDDTHIGKVVVPIPKDANILESIDELVSEANRLRTEAYILEEEAIELVNKELFN